MSEKENNKVVPKVKYEYQVSVDYDCTFSDYDSTLFTLIDKYYTDKRPNLSGGVHRHLSTNEIIEFINKDVQTVTKKDQCPGILKGIYQGGTSGQYCAKPAPFLFLDIDVKENENQALLQPGINTAIFSKIEQLSLFTFRSFSRRGFASCIYVPKLSEIGVLEKAEHLSIARSINQTIVDLIYRETGIIIKLDDAQNKFRQIRFLAPQDNEIKLNNRAPAFLIDRSEILQKKTHTGVPLFTKSTSTCSRYSIEYQYNQNTKVTELLRDYHVSEDRYRLPGTTSASSGVVDELNNVFVNFSTSFSPFTRHTPFWLAANLFHDGDPERLRFELIKQGYEVIKPEIEDIEKAVSLLQTENVSDEKVYEICNEFAGHSVELKYKLIDKLNLNNSQLKKIEVYLGVASLQINYDQTFEIDYYVSECFEDLLNYVDLHYKICVKSETGTGKTTAILKGFSKLRPHSRCLIIEPLTSIVDQLGHQYPDVSHLTGESSQSDFDLARNSSIVISTMEQAIPFLQLSHFDYVFVDEFHGLLTTNQYKREQVSELTSVLESNKKFKIIGLTGTLLEVIRSIGYHLVSIEKKGQVPVEVIERHSNVNPYNILLQHNAEVKGKAIYRLNSTKNLKIFKEQLVEQGYFKEKEILVLHSDPTVKAGKDYKDLLQNGSFRDDIQIVLTTSFIDEGISIEQIGFTDVVFIEGSTFYPRPEAVKQFFARFRNVDPQRKNFFYRKVCAKDSVYNSMDEEYSNLIKKLDHYRSLDFKFKGVYSSKEYLYSSGVVNPYFTAFKASQRYFGRLPAYEFNRFVELNYNIRFNVDNEYQNKTQDVDYQKEKRKDWTKTLNRYWREELDEIYSFVRQQTQDSVLKNELHAYNFPVNERSFLFFRSHMKALEGYVRKSLILSRMGLREELFIYKPNGELKAMQALNNDVRIGASLYDYFNHSSGRTVDPLRAFIDEFRQRNRFSFKEVKHHVYQVNPLIEVNKKLFVGILECFMDLYYDKRNKVYMVKAVHDLDWVHSQFFYKKEEKLSCDPGEMQNMVVGLQLNIFTDHSSHKT